MKANNHQHREQSQELDTRITFLSSGSIVIHVAQNLLKYLSYSRTVNSLDARYMRLTFHFILCELYDIEYASFAQYPHLTKKHFDPILSIDTLPNKA